MTSLDNRKVEYVVYWLGNGDEIDQSRVACLIENNIQVNAFSNRDALESKINDITPNLLVIANFSDAQANMKIGLELKSSATNTQTTLMMVIEHLDMESKEYYYQSGGNELVLEPASLTEIFFRIRHLKYTFDEQNNAKIQIEEASQMALLAMENSSDLGSTINFVKSATRCQDYESLAKAIFHAVKVYSDSAIVEMVGAETLYYFGSDGNIDPDLKKLLLENKHKTRIVRFDNAFQINHKNLVLLAEGLPIEDVPRMGRIADNLAILADTADRFVSELLLREQSVIAELAKRRFISTISHELNTPMNAIQGFSKIFAERGEGEKIGKKGVTALRSINTNAEKMKTIIKTLIDITGDDVAKGELSMTVIQVSDLILKLKNDCAPLAEKKSFALIFPEDIDIEFKGDKKHICKMLFHLMDNAIKFTEDGEVSLTITTKPDPVLGEVIEFSIQDTGIGISKANIGRLFTHLGQLDVSHERTQYGAGLGLFYVHSFAKQLGGNVSVKSIEGEGSEFILSLPSYITKNSNNTELF